jgi:murein DD-endopeptidase MepM/ murein hydrolase activator NlpD
MAAVPPKGTYRGLLGIDMRASPGTHELRVVATDANQKRFIQSITLTVKRVAFGIQRLTLPPSQVDLDRETLERVKKEARRMRAVLKEYRNERLWKGSFIRPLEADVSSAFGLRRILNGQERSPHTGVDLRAPEGTPVMACNRGTVVLVDNLFFSGKSVVLDHGWGMYSMYFHLSRVLVDPGDIVARGEILGLAGATGRATGPHLHWGIRLNGARVDPLSILRLGEHLEE